MQLFQDELRVEMSVYVSSGSDRLRVPFYTEGVEKVTKIRKATEAALKRYQVRVIAMLETCAFQTGDYTKQAAIEREAENTKRSKENANRNL